VVDNGSRDGTVAAVRARHRDVEVLALDRDHGAAARNVGLRSLDAPYVSLCDDDSWWAPGALERAARAMDAAPRVAVLAARVLVGDEERLDPTCELMAASPMPPAAGLPWPRVLGFVACGAVVRREAVLAVGGFDRHYGIGGEENQLALNLAAAGWWLAYAPDVVAHHHPGRRRTSGAVAPGADGPKRPVDHLAAPLAAHGGAAFGGDPRGRRRLGAAGARRRAARRAAGAPQPPTARSRDRA
jgi:GT2 family glycosyltransferase